MGFKIKRNDQIGMFFFAAFVIGTSLIWFFEERFNSKQWKSSPGMRYKIVEDLLDNKLIVGKRKAAVIVLLGEGEVYNVNGKEHMEYRLGIKPTFFEEKREKLTVVFKYDVATEVIHSKEKLK
ncbi:hypothetical protein [uncultured Lacinutrix sp.]|uniref:hypothetical protein n=1 Tax=uncultured Lacinutrix sp. TaxID=574032 RepID=UPI002607175A|nr:hypothetical protein [uncultured Lacinutrix sp.]